IATRQASSCLPSIQQRSSAIRPYSPNATVLPRIASPVRLPRCILRYFTFSGCNAINFLLVKPLTVESFKRSPLHASPLQQNQFVVAPSAAFCSFFWGLFSPLQIQHLMPSLP